ncbi:MAG: hypothetical protein K9N46_07615 [Candidatus Marinimicrobia bacterium]|nr:hypothetical protein [Candidatus Neomarinimicrobiota bacterium]MCF7880591.1 hypothetical protein [Candidatus Neomarinimicrobiota bacterium]
MAEVTAHQQKLVDTVAEKVVKYKMTVPMLLFLESVRPLNFIGSQAMLMFHPFLNVFFNAADIDAFRKFLEKRENLEYLMRAIEEKEEGKKGIEV